MAKNAGFLLTDHTLNNALIYITLKLTILKNIVKNKDALAIRNCFILIKKRTWK